MSEEASASRSGEEIPSLKEMLQAVGGTSAEDNRQQAVYEKTYARQSIEAQRAYAHLAGLVAHYSHKGIWSWFLMGAMGFMIVFQSILLGLVGSGVWNFTAYRWLLPLLLVQNLGQIIGLAVIVVKSLFTKLDPH
ncbi:hypothetical protein AB4037_23125 [Labrys sp. KB_33_2]|uniref:hypothetical protein n=1 Tax=Labrys sp. KB_33_2 TaxID=3237479 RepID=UPI003F8FFD6C